MSAPEDPAAEVPRPRPDHHTVRGERSTVAVHRRRSLESRLGNVLALGLVCSTGFALLVWYYHAALVRSAHRDRGAALRAASRAQTEMPLPPLGPIGPPPLSGAIQAAAASLHGPPAVQSVQQASTDPPLGRARRLYRTLPEIAPARAYARGGREPDAARVASAAERSLQRRLAGPVFATSSGLGAPSGSSARADRPGETPGGTAQAVGARSAGAAPRGSAPAPDTLEQLLVPTVTRTALARVLPSRSLVLPKGSVIDCTLETAIDSTLPGMTTCVTATDTFGADGKVVLLERGSQLVGQTRGVVEQGSARVFVLWTEARTPTGVVIPLASPGTDELGRSGLSGRVDRHFWQRFGAAMLISIIDAGAQIGAQSGSNTIIYDPSETQNVATEVLGQTLRIPPQVVKNQGGRLEVLVARDLDFRSVYALRSIDARH